MLQHFLNINAGTCNSNSIRSQNANSREYLESIVESTHSQLKMLAGAPSVQMQDTPGRESSLVPDDDHDDLEDELDPDVRRHAVAEERRQGEAEGEFYDGDGDQD